MTNNMKNYYSFKTEKDALDFILSNGEKKFEKYDFWKFFRVFDDNYRIKYLVFYEV